VELWEVSLVTFPMLPQARVGAKADAALARDLRELAAALADARRRMAGH
jgi:phage head maturation protease